VSSAFGVEHIAKAERPWYKRDAQGRFAAWSAKPKPHVMPDGKSAEGVPFDDDEYEDEAESTRVDKKSMWANEGTAHHKESVRQLELAHDYYRYRGEHDMADEVADDVEESIRRHHKYLKTGTTGFDEQKKWLDRRVKLLNEQDVKKSMVEPGVFRAARAMTGFERNVVRTGGQYKAAHGVSEAGQRFKEVHEAAHKLAKTPMFSSNRVQVTPGLGSGSGGTVRLGSAKRGRSFVGGQASAEHAPMVQAHEEQHANVKRSSYRLHGQVMQDPEKLLREEGRADYHSHGHYSHIDFNNASAYATGARAAKQTETHGKDAPFFTHEEHKMLQGHGLTQTREELTNERVMQGAAKQVDANTPHYRLSEGERGHKAFKAYADLHDQMRAKGVPEKGAVAQPKSKPAAQTAQPRQWRPVTPPQARAAASTSSSVAQGSNSLRARLFSRKNVNKGLNARNMAALERVGRGLGKENMRAQDWANAKLASRLSGRAQKDSIQTRRAKIDMARAVRHVGQQPLP